MINHTAQWSLGKSEQPSFGVRFNPSQVNISEVLNKQETNVARSNNNAAGNGKERFDEIFFLLQIWALKFFSFCQNKKTVVLTSLLN